MGEKGKRRKGEKGEASSSRSHWGELVVHVTPRAARDGIVGWRPDGALSVRVTAPPVDGAANERVIELVAQALGVARRQVVLMAGTASRIKRLRVDGRSGDEVKRLMGAAGSKAGDRSDGV